jgi:AraC-like DNA-binding protein
MLPTTITSWALCVVRAAESYGVDGDSLLALAGLDPALLRDPHARYPVTNMSRLWEQASKATGDPAFGLEVARFWHPTTLHALGFAWMASDTLEQAFSRLERYFRLMTTAGAVRIETDGDDYLCVLVPAPGYARFQPAVSDAGAATLVRMCALLYGDEFAPRKVELDHPGSGREDRYREVLACPVTFDRPRNAIHLDRGMLEQRLPTANLDLAHANDRLITEYLAHLDQRDLPANVKARLIDMLPSGGLLEEQVAHALNMSLRSLQRRLKEQDVTFRTLLDDTRRELALVYVRNPNATLAEVSYLLGFSEPSNFTRAFRRWTGMTPTRFRSAEIARVA